MSDSSPLLDRAGIEEAFRRLGDRLARRGVVADLYVFGGAAMALAYDSRRATRDVDALFKPHGIVLEEALAVAAELGLPRWWLNEQASSYVAPDGDSAASRVFDHPGLRVFAASPEHLLAMKALARGSRPRTPGTPVAFVGEAKHRDRRLGLAELRRLQHLRDLLTAAGHDASDAVVGVFSTAGFTDDLAAEAAASRGKILLATLSEFYDQQS